MKFVNIINTSQSTNRYTFFKLSIRPSEKFIFPDRPSVPRKLNCIKNVPHQQQRQSVFLRLLVKIIDLLSILFYTKYTSPYCSYLIAWFILANNEYRSMPPPHTYDIKNKLICRSVIIIILYYNLVMNMVWLFRYLITWYKNR